MESSLPFICELVIFLSIILMSITRKNQGVVYTYAVQSLAVVVLLAEQALRTGSVSLGLLAAVTFAVKVVVVPQVFLRFIRRNREHISTGTYLSSSVTLVVLILLVIVVQSGVFSPKPDVSAAVLLMIDSALMSFFMAINRKGAILQIVGSLSLENSIFALGYLSDPAISDSLEIAILFDVMFWAIIAGTYLRLMYRHARSLDVTSLRELKK